MAEPRPRSRLGTGGQGFDPDRYRSPNGYRNGHEDGYESRRPDRDWDEYWDQYWESDQDGDSGEAHRTGPDRQRQGRPSQPAASIRIDVSYRTLAAMAVAATAFVVARHSGVMDGVGTGTTTLAVPAAATAPASAATPAAPAAAAGPAAATAPAAGASGAGVVTGKPVDTDFGPMQVAITVKDGRIVATRAVQVTTAGKTSVSINRRSLPQLYRQTLERQSAKLDAISGATVTTDGYRRALQSAIDEAHLVRA
jgi:uncharacterized protein with FMN-binding domain